MAFNFIQKIKEINSKYKTPQIKTSRGVKIALFVLRVYLIAIVGILIFKFITTIK